MLNLFKNVFGKWEDVRRYLYEDLDHIETAINQRWAETFGDNNQLDLSGDVITGELPLDKIEESTSGSKLLGRGTDGAGPWEPISLGTGLAMSGTTLSSAGTVTATYTPLASIVSSTPQLVFNQGDVINVLVTPFNLH